ncbi:hypothetical protein [Bradyrhizobium liaoningense]|uniref:hypothetical protein n=1 Tax=Bradyrhizobium liaoningense TaxID=43992 RepID=UPI001BA8D883|nr:hypothetical protein [Bradyrhizobium liaoningense]MBR0716170.1 hypothetical protein [Bradyrhizobium liaoningense]
MRFVLVNDRTPFRKTFCLQCCKEISDGYLREIGTLIPYCTYECYALQREFESRLESRRRAAS